MGERALSRGLIVIVLVVAGALVGGIAGSVERAPIAPGVALDPELPRGERSIEVHVAGWVVSPGVVRIPDGSIVADAIEAAGGLRAGALPDLINLATPLRSGDQVVVPGPMETGEAAAADGLLALNRANSTELQGLPGVGPVLAERIVAYREKNGPFSVVEDLLEVPGIGESKLASIRDLVRVP